MRSDKEYKELTIKEFSYSLDEVKEFCDRAGLKTEKLERAKKYRLHLVARK